MKCISKNRNEILINLCDSLIGGAKMTKISKTIVENNTLDSPVYIFRLSNIKGHYVEITNIGASIMKIVVSDLDSNLVDVALGYDEALSYLTNPYYLGCTLGPTAGRIENASFEIDKEKHVVDKNDGDNCLHGGRNSFSSKVFELKESSDKEKLVLSHKSIDGENGFPGNVEIEVSFSFSDEDKLSICYSGKTDKATILNLSNHTYFNLNGHSSRSVENHYAKLNSSHYGFLNDNFIATREVALEASDLDFRSWARIGDRLKSDNLQILKARGLDHNFVIQKQQNRDMNNAAELYSPQSGILLQMFTTKKCFQFYTGNFLNEKTTW